MHEQNIQHLDQCGVPSQMAQPIMLCPIQFFYDAQTNTQMVVQHNEEHIQRPQPMLLNVQNTPPWIQNQTQNVIYVQQTPNQMLPYLQPNLNIRNPIFQTPYNFPQMIPQESIRPVMQIPTLIQNDTIKNQPTNLNYPGAPILHQDMTQSPTVNINFNRAIEKMPFLSQNQVNAALKAEMMELNQFNTVVSSETMPNEAQNQVNYTKSETKPFIAQNQVNLISNTEMMSIEPQIQRKSKEKMPILTHLLNKIPLECENKPVMQNQQVQTDFPIAKTSNHTNNIANQASQYVSINNVPQNIEKANEIPQLNPRDAREHYKAVISYDQRHIRPIRPNITKNPEVPLHIKRKIQDTVNVRAIYRPILPRPIVRPYQYKGPNFVNANFVKLRAPNPVQALTIPNSGVMTNYTVVNEDTNTLNKNNNKTAEVQTITSINSGTIIYSNTDNKQDIKPQHFEKDIDNTKFVRPIDKVPKDKLNLVRIEEISIEEYEVVEYIKKKEGPRHTDDKSDELKSTSERNNKTYNTGTQILIKGSEEIEQEVAEEVGQEKVIQEKNTFVQVTKKEINLVDRKIEEKNTKNGIFILTHVLDGHVIQESNVAFPIHKPAEEKITHEPYTMTTNWQNDVEPLLPLKYLHIIDNDKLDLKNDGLRIKEDTDNPFLNLTKCAVEAWNMDQLSSHLTKHNWKETAIKLKEQEIDGESLLLVSEQQLVYIGVSEKHAELISEFVNKCC